MEITVTHSGAPESQKLERLRRSFQPAKVQLLFVGESPPASGRFFYRRDSGLYRAMLDVFHSVDSSIDERNFLAIFQDAGCYLIDLCPTPVDRLEPESRRAECRGGEPLLARTIARLQPAIVAPLLRRIEGNVKRAADGADWHGTWLALPYPGRWSRYKAAFLESLTPTVRELLTVIHRSEGFSSRAGIR